MRFTGDNGVFEFDINNVDYVCKTGTSIIVYDIHGIQTTITIANHYSMKSEIKRFVRTYHKKLATIGALLGGIGAIYFFNCANIYSLDKNDDEIDVTFKSGYTITAININSTDATNNYDYMEYRRISNNLDNYKEGKTIRYVTTGENREELGISASLIYYNIQEAIDDSEQGDFIIIKPGIYVNEEINLKQGVDLEFTDGVEFRYNSNDVGTAITDEIAKADCMIFGYGKFYHDRQLSVDYSWLQIELRNNSNVYFEFDSIYSASAIVNSTLHINSGKLWLHGRVNYGTYNRAFDSDNNTKLIDNDILFNLNDGGDTLYFPLNVAQDGTDYIYRNGYYENNGTGVPKEIFLLNDSYCPRIRFINIEAVNDNKQEQSNILVTGGVGNPGDSCFMWYSYFWSNNEEGQMVAVDPAVIHIYDNCYFNHSNLGVEIEGTAEAIIEEEMILTRPQIE